MGRNQTKFHMIWNLKMMPYKNKDINRIDRNQYNQKRRNFGTQGKSVQS